MSPHINNINTFSPPHLCLCPTSLYSTLLCPSRLSACTPAVPLTSSSLLLFREATAPLIIPWRLSTQCFSNLVSLQPFQNLSRKTQNYRSSISFKLWIHTDPRFDISFIKFPFTSRMSSFIRYHEIPNLLWHLVPKSAIFLMLGADQPLPAQNLALTLTSVFNGEAVLWTPPAVQRYAAAHKARLNSTLVSQNGTSHLTTTAPTPACRFMTPPLPRTLK